MLVFLESVRVTSVERFLKKGFRSLTSLLALLSDQSRAGGRGKFSIIFPVLELKLSMVLCCGSSLFGVFFFRGVGMENGVIGVHFF